MCRQRMHHDDRRHSVNVRWKREFPTRLNPSAVCSRTDSRLAGSTLFARISAAGASAMGSPPTRCVPVTPIIHASRPAFLPGHHVRCTGRNFLIAARTDVGLARRLTTYGLHYPIVIVAAHAHGTQVSCRK